MHRIGQSRSAGVCVAGLPVGMALGMSAGLMAGSLTGSACAGDGSGGGSGDDTPYATIEFRADRTTAAVGETVTWTVWAHWGVREDDSDRAFLRGFTGALLANPRSHAEITSFTEYMISVPFPAVISGASIDSISFYQNALLGTDDTSNPIGLCTFDTVIEGDSTPLWYDARGAGGVEFEIFLCGYEFCSVLESVCPNALLWAFPCERFPLSVRTDVVNWRGCDATDAAAPFGVKDAADIGEFVRLLGERQPIVDFAEPYGVYDLHDIVGFIDRFMTPCE